MPDFTHICLSVTLMDTQGKENKCLKLFMWKYITYKPTRIGIGTIVITAFIISIHYQ